MRVSLSWIRHLLAVPRLPLEGEALQERLTLRSTEIEAIESVAPNLAGVVVGRVLSCVPHPNADRLRLTTVDLGAAEPVPIVCGAANVAAGQTVAVATVGTTLSMKQPDGTMKSLTIKAAKLRGCDSHGMICAEDELGLGSSHDGILVLDAALVPGTPLATALGLGDQVLVIDNHGITHRPDLWGHWGWAHEIAALTGLPTPAVPDSAWSDTAGAWSVTLADRGCPVYCGALVSGVHNQASPAWLRDRLMACGIRPLGLLIDVTNYVMLELGEPMHAFDRRQLRGTRISVRAASDGERLTTLDGVERQLAAGDLLICDEQRPIALAGIMGGANSLIAADTDAVLLEAASFAPERIRRTRVRLGLTTDSSARFEKGLALEVAPAAILRAIAILQQCCPAAVVEQRFHAGATAGERRRIASDPALYGRYMGRALPSERQDELLARLGIVREGEAFTVPWWRRKDLHRAVDLVEELARSQGFEHIVPEVPRLPAATPTPNPLRNAEHRARAVLSAQGWDEVATYGFTADAWATLLAVDPARLIRLRNPLTAEWTVLRPSLIPTLAEAVGRNRKHFGAVRIYEIGKRYGSGLGHGATPDEELQLVALCAAAADQTPFYAARDAGLALLRGLGYDATLSAEARGVESDLPAWQPGRTATLLVGDMPVAWCGELAKPIRDQAQCPERTGLLVVALERLVREVATPKPRRFVPPSRFPAVAREFTWICPEALSFAALAESTRRAAKGLCRNVSLLTVYRGAPYAAGEKAVSLAVALQAEDRTMDEDELTAVQNRIASAVSASTGATLRA